VLQKPKMAFLSIPPPVLTNLYRGGSAKLLILGALYYLV
jgi:hypothetical protein